MLQVQQGLQLEMGSGKRKGDGGKMGKIEN
jgi:hypothetical protein